MKLTGRQAPQKEYSTAAFALRFLSINIGPSQHENDLLIQQ